MTSERIFNLCYNALRIFHWGLFFIVVEIMFWYAGWMIFGIIGNVLSWATFSISGQDYSKDFSHYLQMAGKAFGVLAGVLFTRFVMSRYFKSSSE